MSALSLQHTKQWIKTSDHPLASFLFKNLKALTQLEFPAPRFVFRPLYSAFRSLQMLVTTATRLFWWTPLLKGRLNSVGKNLYLYGGLPYITGPLNIDFGDNCRVSGQTTFSGRSCARQTPELRVGSNIDIGWMTTIAIGSKVVLGNNVRIAGRSLLAGYPGHPVDPEARAAGLPENDEQVGDIILEDDVWLATGVTVTANVRIGRGTIVAAGSVVTSDLPPMVLAGGIPAKVIRHLDTNQSNTGE